MSLITLSINNNNQLANNFFSLLNCRIKPSHLIILISIFLLKKLNHLQMEELIFPCLATQACQ